MDRIFAIGDIHGCNKTFRKLLLEELRVTPKDMIYCLGDYVDRGPDSKGVVDFILELRNTGYQIHTLRGNHEQLMLESVLDEESFELWMINGARQTLQSFHATSYDELSTDYKEFFAETQLYIQTEACIFVHAGLDFSSGDPFENTEAMLWTRKTHVDPAILGDRIIVHGHTPLPAEVIPVQREATVINIDGGCVYPHREGYGYLFALEVNRLEFVSVRNVDF